jgi:uncharacterized membrane protein YfcA
VEGLDLALAALAAAGAGFVNALAGGGTLLAFPMLIALGVPPVAANVTSTLALCPGYLGATLAQRDDLRGQRGRLLRLVPASAAGGVAGGALLLASGDAVFRPLVPFLILLAALLLAVQEPLRRWVLRRAGRRGDAPDAERWAVPAVALAGIYGGYFGAGVSVIVLAVLGATLDDALPRLNALKQALALAANLAAALFFVVSGPVVWPAVAVMAAGALAGGMLGGRVAGRLRASTLRWTVVAAAVAIAAIDLLR